ncbi:hypothetical protein [Variovorax rhizosphaerae]|uniref:ABC transporter permease n=1 Tax=Variovorax rhizosphaerae TaxID=1836200 RepID=A0ABU8WDF1_9BURK
MTVPPRADGTGLGDLPGGSLDVRARAMANASLVPVIALFLLGIALVSGAAVDVFLSAAATLPQAIWPMLGR